jgi:hypothetical protein
MIFIKKKDWKLKKKIKIFDLCIFSSFQTLTFFLQLSYMTYDYGSLKPLKEKSKDEYLPDD